MASKNQFLITILWLPLTCLAGFTMAQDAPAPAEPAKQRVVFVVEAPPTKLTDDVKELFGRAVSQTPGCKASKVQVEPISKSVRDSMRRMIDGNKSVDVNFAGSGEVRQLTEPQFDQDGNAKASLWEVSVGDAFATVSSIKLYFGATADGPGKEEEKPLEFKAQRRDEANAPFRFHAPGSYVLALDTPTLPSSFELQVQKEGEAPKSLGKRPWPQTGRYYIVEMEDFVGDQKKLFDTLKNAEVIGDAAKTVSVPKAVSITSISYTIGSEPPVEILDATHYAIHERKPVTIFPKRVWVYFPLTATEQKDKLREWNLMARKVEGRAQLLKTITDNAMMATAEAKIPLDGAAKWYELPAMKAEPGKQLPPNVPVGDFYRIFTVEREFVNKAPAGDQEPVYGIKAYEFELAGGKETFLLEVNGGRVVGSHHPNFISGLRSFSPSKNP